MLQQQLIIRALPNLTIKTIKQRRNNLSSGQIDRADPSAAIVTRGKYQLPDVLFLDQSTRKNLAAVNLPTFPCRMFRISGILFWWALLKMRNCLLRKLRLRCGICGSGANQPYSRTARVQTAKPFVFSCSLSPLPDEFLYHNYI